MLDLNFIIPEIFLTLSILVFVLIGVFVKNSFEIIYKLSLFLIFLLIVIIFSNNDEYSKIFNESISIDMFSIYSKILIFFKYCFRGWFWASGLLSLHSAILDKPVPLIILSQDILSTLR